MIYIVTGQPAGGTSMMMRVLIEGGIEGIYRKEFVDPIRHKITLANQHNPHGTFEGNEGTEWSDRDNKCIKILGLNLMPKEEAKVVWIRRNPEHISQSRQERSMRRHGGVAIRECPQGRVESLNKINATMKEFFSNNNNLDCYEIDFIKMNEDTEQEVNKLAKFLDYPNFNIDKAVKAVDKSLYTKRT